MFVFMFSMNVLYSKVVEIKLLLLLLLLLWYCKFLEQIKRRGIHLLLVFVLHYYYTRLRLLEQQNLESKSIQNNKKLKISNKIRNKVGRLYDSPNPFCNNIILNFEVLSQKRMSQKKGGARPTIIRNEAKSLIR